VATYQDLISGSVAALPNLRARLRSASDQNTADKELPESAHCGAHIIELRRELKQDHEEAAVEQSRRPLLE
jgi:hypothetical protein